MRDCKTIVVAGASGYIGKNLIPQLLEKFPKANIIAFSRSEKKSDNPRLIWKACDLFSLKSIEAAMPKQVDLAYYLVHSMGPTAHLDQGNFADYDLILADNFARAIEKTEVQHLIYLGGLLYEGQNLSPHLKSRLEVEEVFRQRKLPATVFRAGLILGESGSSFQILLKLVKRLPVMICPTWTQNLTSPIDLNSVLEALRESALNSKNIGYVYDLAGCKALSYLEMMEITSRKLGLKRLFIKIHFFSAYLSRLWVSLVTNTPKNLVYPLVESLRHPMLPRPSHLYFNDRFEKKYEDLLDETSLTTYPGRLLFGFRANRKTVRSVQRLHLPLSHNAQWIKEEYLKWLPQFFRPLITVKSDGLVVFFLLLGLPLLGLKISTERSTADRQLLYIVSGLLAGNENQGRLEFREVLGGKFVLAAIHNYKPSLPWFIYILTQAKIHLMVMKNFGKHLEKNF